MARWFPKSNAAKEVGSEAVNDQRRIAELNHKATQLLTFLSFALVAAILLETAQVNVLTACQKIAVKWSLRFWVFSIFPILLIVLPVKEWCAMRRFGTSVCG